MIAGPSFLVPYRRRRRSSGGSTVPPAPAAPDTPSAPSPGDAATAYYTRLSWMSARAAKVDLYLDTVNPPATLVVPKYVGTSYVPTLLPGTTYYWKIVAFNDGGSAIGPVWSFTTPAASAVLVALDGVIVTTRAQIPEFTIREVKGPSPNSAAVLFKGVVPTGGQSVQIGYGTLDDENLLFAGENQTLDQEYVGTPQNGQYRVDLVDHTFRINKRRPFGTWVNVSATTIARYCIAVFAPGFTAVHVQADLPAVSMNFDGADDFMTCMARLADAISTFAAAGRVRLDYSRDLHLFIGTSDENPDPIDAENLPLNDPPIRFTVDHSQIRTRVYGKGAGETVPCDVAAGETIVPIKDASNFEEGGGEAIVGTTSGGAQTQIITYAGVHLGGGGSLVGPGAAPTVAPAAAVSIGAGVEAGVHGYAYTDITAAGESLPSPSVAVTVGFLANPAAAPTVVAAAGLGIEDGVHRYAYTDVTAAGETLPTPIASVTHAPSQAAPTAIGTAVVNPSGTGPLTINTNFSYGFTFKRTADGVETTISPTTTFNSGPNGQNATVPLAGCTAAPSGWTRQWYRTKAAGGTFFQIPLAFGSESGGNFNENAADSNLSATTAPATNGTAVNRSSLSAIAAGPTGTTARKIYRTVAAGSQLKLLTTIGDNVTTTYADSTADASLGANAPTSSTATANQVSVSLIAVGVSPTTSRKLYRTVAGGSQLKLLTPIADNTTTTFTDSTPDASLGANAPTGDTSGLTQPSGQVNPGSTLLLTASAAPFHANGGWATLSGGQTVRYTGISTNTLTGIPASGAGSITTTVLYGSQVLPAPALTGVNSNNGLTLAMASGASVNIWVQVDDLDAQAILGLLERDEDGNPTDGIREYTIIDTRRDAPSLRALCTADLAIFSRPIVSTQYDTLDRKTHAGLTVPIDLSIDFFDHLFYDSSFYDGDSWGLSGEFTIQSVAIAFPDGVPRWSVAASSVAFTLSDLFRRAIIG